MGTGVGRDRQISLWAEEIWEGHGEVAGPRGLGGSQSQSLPASHCHLDIQLGSPCRQGLHELSQ